jgi:hypothetical protein
MAMVATSSDLPVETPEKVPADHEVRSSEKSPFALTRCAGCPCDQSGETSGCARLSGVPGE